MHGLHPCVGAERSSLMQARAGSSYPSFTDIRCGNGRPIQPGSVIRCHYEGRLANIGASKDDNSLGVFDSSRGKAPFVFVLGEGEVIQGWDLGLTAVGLDGEPMREGGIRRLLIPPELAYGGRGIKDPKDPQRFLIPPDSSLEFDIELLPTDGFVFRLQWEAGRVKERVAWWLGELLRGPG